MRPVRLKSVFFLILWAGTVAAGVQLGAWQLDRLAWKNTWLAQIDLAYQQPPADHVERITTPPATYFARARVALDYQPGEFFFVRPRTHQGRVGAHVYQRARLPGGQEILVNRGFVDENAVANVSVVPQRGPEVVQIHPPRWGGQAQDGRGNKWSFMSKNIGGYHDLVATVEPTTDDQGHRLIPVGTRPAPNNNHLSYAMFWLTMSGIAFLWGSAIIVRAWLLHRR